MASRRAHPFRGAVFTKLPGAHGLRHNRCMAVGRGGTSEIRDRLSVSGGGRTTPTDNTRQVDVEADETQFALIPAVGDFVDIPAEDDDIRNVPLRGKVRSRLFRYVLGYCYVTVVVEDTDEVWTKISPR